MDNVWVNGQQGQLIPANDRGLTYGDGLFVTMRIDAKGQIQFFQTHLSRITQAAYRLKFQTSQGLWQLPEQQIELVKRIAAKNPNKGLKLLISRGVGGRGYSSANCNDISTVISLFEIPNHYQQLQQTGVSLCKSQIQLASQPLLSGIKHLNRLEQVLIKSCQLSAGFDDWLVVDSNDRVIEASMANLFLFKDNKWLTPRISQSGVAGVMREQTIYQLLNFGFDVEITDISFSELTAFEHIIMTNSLMGAMNINQVDTLSFEPWRLTGSLNKALGVSL